MDRDKRRELILDWLLTNPENYASPETLVAFGEEYDELTQRFEIPKEDLDAADDAVKQPEWVVVVSFKTNRKGQPIRHLVYGPMGAGLANKRAKGIRDTYEYGGYTPRDGFLYAQARPLDRGLE